MISGIIIVVLSVMVVVLVGILWAAAKEAVDHLQVVEKMHDILTRLEIAEYYVYTDEHERLGQRLSAVKSMIEADKCTYEALKRTNVNLINKRTVLATELLKMKQHLEASASEYNLAFGILNNATTPTHQSDKSK
jgi:hypothetical protein